MRDTLRQIIPGRVAALFAGFFMLGALAVFPMHASETKEKAPWQSLKSGSVFAIMRHAIAPGTGDPANFKVGDCSTQRNLSEKGRAQARKAGEIFRSHGVHEALVYTSEWCRCRETARLLGLGPAHDIASLNSFFEAYERRQEQTRQLKSWLRQRPEGKPLVLVTHQVNISALTGSGTRSGEIVFVKPTSSGRHVVVGRLVP